MRLGARHRPAIDSGGLAAEVARSEARISAFPPLEALYAAATWWLSRSPSWTRRHVLTVKLESDRQAHMRLVVDIELPSDHGASFAWTAAQRLFVVPVTTFGKEAKPAYYELFDEGANAPVSPREDGARLSATAIERAAAQALAGIEPGARKQLLWFLRLLTLDVTPASGFYLAAFQERCSQLGLGSNPSSPLQNLLQLAVDLSRGSMLWVPIAGLPGELRSVRLEHHQKIDAPKVSLPLRRFKEVTPVKVTGQAKPWTLREQPHDHNRRGAGRRAWNRVAEQIGLAPFQLRIQEPYLRRTFSYHLQVESPLGIDVRVMRLNVLVTNNGLPVDLHKSISCTRGHLSFSNATEIGFNAGALIHFRVGRPGPLFFSALTATLIAVMLWLFAKCPELALAHLSVAGPALLVVPTVLIIFASRPGEHPLISRLLVGVRIVVLFCGICAVAAASALAGVLPFGPFHAVDPNVVFVDLRTTPFGQMYATLDGGHFWESVGSDWESEAIVASVAAVVLIASWVLSYEPLERARVKVRKRFGGGLLYGRITVGFLVFQVALGELLSLRDGPFAPWRTTIAVGLLVSMVLGAWVASYGEVTKRRFDPVLLAVVAVVSLVTLFVFVAYGVGPLGSGFLGVARCVSYAALGAFWLTVKICGCGRKKARLPTGCAPDAFHPGPVRSAGSDSDAPAIDDPGHDWFAPSMQGEDMATLRVRSLAAEIFASADGVCPDDPDESWIRRLVGVFETRKDPIRLVLPPALGS
jgi:hypothetical protein